MSISSADPQCATSGSNPIVLVLQGGGALGAYQVGVYQAMHEAGIEPDWVIGTSIGAINASIIAGNPPAERMERLTAFWSRMQHNLLQQAVSAVPSFGGAMVRWWTVAGGIPGFFLPNPMAFASTQVPLGATAAGYYSTTPLEETLRELVNFDLINAGPMRLTVGAANVRSAEMRYFDSRDMPLAVAHVMASGALPPAFPAIRIDGELYWDGGILSNTPVEAVFDDFPRRSSLVFAVHIWNPQGAEPTTIAEVMHRHKDIQYSSRAVTHVRRQKELHRLRHVISELARKLPPESRGAPEVEELANHGCLTRMHVVRLLAPALEGDDHSKDIDFSPVGVRARWNAGYEDMKQALRMAPWKGDFDPIEGVILHEVREGVQVASG